MSKCRCSNMRRIRRDGINVDAISQDLIVWAKTRREIRRGIERIEKKTNSVFYNAYLPLPIEISDFIYCWFKIKGTGEVILREISIKL